MERPADHPGSQPLDALSLAGILCARLCHDLAGTLGALSGMLDMVGADRLPAQDGEALQLARSCARELTDRLRLLRAAWGTDSEVGQPADLLPGLPNAERLKLDVSALEDLPDEAVRRLVANLLLIAAMALPRGGTITLSGGPQGMKVEVEGVRASWPDVLSHAMDDIAGLAKAASEPRQVGIAIALLQASNLGLEVKRLSDQTLKLEGRASKPDLL